jgi:hypothetical protein
MHWPLYCNCVSNPLLNFPVLSLEELVQVSARTHADITAAKPKITQGTSVVSAQKTPVAAPQTAQPIIKGQVFILNAYYCKYCSRSCNGQKQWDDHCSSEKHMFNVNSDKEHQWNYRQPPWGVQHGNYKLCNKYVCFDQF